MTLRWAFLARMLRIIYEMKAENKKNYKNRKNISSFKLLIIKIIKYFV